MSAAYTRTPAREGAAWSELTYERDIQARDLNRSLHVIALRAREMALHDGTTSEGADALRGVAKALGAIASYAGTICHADAGNDLAIIGDTASDICAALERVHHTPELSAVDIRNNELDARCKSMRENAA